MEKLEQITTVFSVMNRLGVSLDELNAYSSSQNRETLIQRELPLEVLYDDDNYSFSVEKGKTPIAVLVENIGMAMEKVPQQMPLCLAKEHCEKLKIGGRQWQLPTLEYLEIIYRNKDAINKVFKAWGKKPLRQDWYWSCDGYADNNFWGLNMGNGEVNAYSKKAGSYVHPVFSS